jgi:hypothetical protein
VGTVLFTSGLRSFDSGGAATVFLLPFYPKHYNVFSGDADAAVGATSARHSTHQFPSAGFHLASGYDRAPADIHGSILVPMVIRIAAYGHNLRQSAPSS